MNSARSYEAGRGRRLGRTFALAGLLGLSGCTDWAGYDLDYFWDVLPVLSTMRTSPGFDPYDMPRMPPENSVPQSNPSGDIPPPFAQAQLDSAAATFINPFAGNVSAALLARGQTMYRNQCFACHGPTGAGDGPVVGPGKYPLAPPINGAATAGRSDGYIYGVIAVGRGLMPPYGDRLTHADRWAIVAYVRQLQAQGGAVAAPATPPAAVVPAAPADTVAATQP